MRELQRLRADHDVAVLSFELANRDYFAASVGDRGDAFFEHFTELYRDLLAQQKAGGCAYYVLVGENGVILGRFNLYRIKDEPYSLRPSRLGETLPAGAQAVRLAGTAELGYRVAQRFAGRGLATAAVLELCGLAVKEHGLRTLRAATTHVNIASQRVLTKAGFVPVGPADPVHLGGKPGTWYERDLAAAGPDQTVAS